MRRTACLRTLLPAALLIGMSLGSGSELHAGVIFGFDCNLHGRASGSGGRGGDKDDVGQSTPDDRGRSHGGGGGDSEGRDGRRDARVDHSLGLGGGGGGGSNSRSLGTGPSGGGSGGGGSAGAGSGGGGSGGGTSGPGSNGKGDVTAGVSSSGVHSSSSNSNSSGNGGAPGSTSNTNSGSGNGTSSNGTGSNGDGSIGSGASGSGKSGSGSNSSDGDSGSKGSVDPSTAIGQVPLKWWHKLPRHARNRHGSGTNSPTPPVVPEPSSVVLMGLGLSAWWLQKRRGQPRVEARA